MPGASVKATFSGNDDALLLSATQPEGGVLILEK